MGTNVGEATGIECSVLVIGGGPAGCSAAIALMERGHAVTLVEKNRHPRFHIGESLLPANVPILRRLGVLDAVREIGVMKLGADFPADNAAGFNVFSFGRALGTTPDYAFQVKREEFDDILFRRAAALGVQVIESAQVTEVDFQANCVSAAALASTGERMSIKAKYVVDASGRNAFLGKKLGLLRRHPRHQSAALFAHFDGVTPRVGANAGNISIYLHKDGWVWMIPLRDGLFSVGLVAQPGLFRARRSPPSEFLLEALHTIPQVRSRMAGASLAGNLHATGNYSYLCRRFAGRRWIMAGDSGAFIDPIFSTGVFLAMRSGVRAAEVVDAVLQQPHRERAIQGGYQREMKRGLRALSWFIVRFTTPAMRWLFANPRNDFGLERAMISMLAGDVFDAPGVRRRLLAFKALYYIVACGRLRESVADWRRRKGAVSLQFVGGTTSQDPA